MPISSAPPAGRSALAIAGAPETIAVALRSASNEIRIGAPGVQDLNGRAAFRRTHGPRVPQALRRRRLARESDCERIQSGGGRCAGADDAGEIVDAIMVFSDLRKRRSQLAPEALFQAPWSDGLTFVWPGSSGCSRWCRCLGALCVPRKRMKKSGALRGLPDEDAMGALHSSRHSRRFFSLAP